MYNAYYMPLYYLVYSHHGYVDIVGRLAKHSMQAAVEEV